MHVKSYTLRMCLLAGMLSAGIIAPTAAQAQTETASPAPDSKTITGHIVDLNTGKPVSYVSVVVQGTTNGATSDDNGTFTLTVPPGAVLVVSSIGYATQNITVGNATDLTIRVSRGEHTLDQVVVVGYGTQRKRDITTAVESVNGEELAKQPVLNAVTALQGKAAGVQITGSSEPGSQPRVTIRGTGTVLGGTNVLYVVDGVLTGDITNINSADILSMDILKDASATAIYGARGANGVIIVTTKKGHSGAPQVTYTGQAGFKNVANMVKMADAAAYTNYYTAANAQAPVTNQPAANTEWYKEILRTAFEQSHSASVSGGSDRSTYLLSIGYFDDQGIVKGSAYKRYTIRLNNDYRLNDHIKVGLITNFANGSAKEANLAGAFEDAYRAAPIIPSIIDGKYGNTSSYGNVGNPLLDISDVDHLTVQNRLQGTAYLEANVIKGLTYRSSVSADYVSTVDRTYNYQFANDETTFITAGGNQQNKSSSLSVSNINALHWVWDNTLNYTKRFGKSSVTALAGISLEENNYTTLSASRSGVAPDPNLWYIGLGDASTAANGGEGIEFWRRASYFGRLNYSYDGRYLLAASLRDDGSSRLPIQNRWHLYPSVSAGWVVSKEAFMASQHIFDELKLRGGYGLVGNDEVKTDAYTSSIASNNAYAFGSTTGTNGAQLQQVVYKNLAWEGTEEYDFGVDFTLVDQRLSGEANYYNKKVKNLLVNVLTAATGGDLDSRVYQNIGSIQNKGFEFALNWHDKISQNLSYHIGGNISFNHNQVLNLNGGQAIPDGSVGGHLVTNTDNGESIASFYVLKAIGVFQTVDEVANYKNAAGVVIQPNANPGDLKYQDTNGDGIIDDKDRIYAGSYQPKAYFGMNLGFNYKNFDFSVDIYGNVGNQVYNGKQANRISGYDNVESDVAYNRWTPGSGIQDQPAANNGNLPASTYFISSGSYVRINNIAVGYTLPASLMHRVKLQNLRIYLTAQNVFTLKKYSGFTAELPGNSPLDAGIEQNAYPTSRVVAFGINAGF